MYKYLYRLGIAVAISCGINVQARPFWEPKCIHIGTDVGRMAYYGMFINPINNFFHYSYTSDIKDYRKPLCPKYSGQQYEFNIAMQCKNIILDFDFGWGNIKWENTPPKGDNIRDEDKIKSLYTSNGKYFKLGLDYNFLRDTPESNAAFLGLRYGMAFFDDTMDSTVIFISEKQERKIINDNNSEIIESQISRTKKLETLQDKNKFKTEQKNVSASWVEAIAGVKLKIIGPVFIGANISYKFWLNIKNATEHKPYHIIGWGLTSDPVDNTVFGANLYLSVAIPVTSEEVYNRKDGKKEIDDKKSIFSIAS